MMKKFSFLYLCMLGCSIAFISQSHAQNNKMATYYSFAQDSSIEDKAIDNRHKPMLSAQAFVGRQSVEIFTYDNADIPYDAYGYRTSVGVGSQLYIPFSSPILNPNKKQYTFVLASANLYRSGFSLDYESITDLKQGRELISHLRGFETLYHMQFNLDFGVHIASNFSVYAGMHNSLLLTGKSKYTIERTLINHNTGEVTVDPETDFNMTTSSGNPLDFGINIGLRYQLKNQIHLYTEFSTDYVGYEPDGMYGGDGNNNHRLYGFKAGVTVPLKIFSFSK